MLRIIIAAVALCLAGPTAQAGSLPGADVYFIGERHDNPHHHETQARLIAEIAPSAIVFEMIPDGALHVLDTLGEDLAQRLDWWGRAAKDVTLWQPVFEVARGLALHGALIDRPAARAAMEAGVVDSFGAQAERWGLAKPLDEAEQAAREAAQQEAHCNAMPAEMLPVLVSLQRMRDAALARAILRAYEQEGGPVAVITGNGHARKDWGAPAVLRRGAPELSVFSIGLGEQGQAPEGAFDRVLADAPSPERGDPCAAFAKD